MHAHSLTHRYAVQAKALHCCVVMYKHMHAYTLEFFQASIDMHIKTVHRPKKCTHKVSSRNMRAHTLSCCSISWISKSTDQLNLFFHKDPGQHQTLHSATTQSKKITSELHQNDHCRATVYQIFLLVLLFQQSFIQRSIPGLRGSKCFLMHQSL